MKKGFVFFMVALFIGTYFGLIFHGIFNSVGNSEHNRSLYKSWIKINPTHKELTFEEWLELKNSNLLQVTR